MKTIVISLLAIAAIVGITMVDMSPAPTEQELYSMGSFGRIDHSAPVMKAYQVDDDYVTTLLTDKYGEYYNTGKMFKD